MTVLSKYSVSVMVGIFSSLGKHSQAWLVSDCSITVYYKNLRFCFRVI